MENGREIIIENDKLNLNFHHLRQKEDTIQQDEDIKEDKNDITNVNDYIKETENENENEDQRRIIYLRLVKMICMAIEFFLCIAFLVVESVIKEKGNNDKIFKGHYSGIATISAFFFIFFILFVLEEIISCIIEKSLINLEILCFWVSQLFYFIDFTMIPSYYSRINYLEEEEIKDISDIKSRYKGLIVISLILTLFIIFLDFIILNLYKDLCCQMDEICNNTFEFIKNLCICIKDIISRVICNSNNEEDEEIKEIIQESKIKKKEVNDLKEEIKNLLSEHINLIADSQIN